MKYFLLICLSALFSLASCTFLKDDKVKTIDSLDSIHRRDSIAKVTSRKSTSKWIIPLTDYWKDPDHFVLMIPPVGDGTDVFDTPEFNSKPTQIFDTLQGRLLNIKNLPDRPNSCGETTYYEVELGPDKIHGWVDVADVYVINSLNGGTFKAGDKTLTFGDMKPFNSLFGDDDCMPIRLVFFYDDSFLYLIQIDETAEQYELRWHDELHISLTGFPPGISLQGQTINDHFEVSFGVPNGKATIHMTFNGDHVVNSFYRMVGVEGDSEGSGEGQ